MFLLDSLCMQVSSWIFNTHFSLYHHHSCSINIFVSHERRKRYHCKIKITSHNFVSNGLLSAVIIFTPTGIHFQGYILNGVKDRKRVRTHTHHRHHHQQQQKSSHNYYRCCKVKRITLRQSVLPAYLFLQTKYTLERYIHQQKCKMIRLLTSRKDRSFIFQTPHIPVNDAYFLLFMLRLCIKQLSYYKES